MHDAPPVRVFISYSHDASDVPFVRRILERVTALKREKLLTYWIDHDLLPGEEWESNITIRIEDADIFLALVSPAYRASQHCTDELDLAVDKAAALKIVPILVRGNLPPHLSKFQALPSSTEPVAGWPEGSEEVYDTIETALRALATGMTDAAGQRQSPDGLEASEIAAAAPRAAANLSSATVEELTLDEWQAAFWHLYGPQDTDARLYEMMLQLVADATRLAEGVRKKRFVEALPYVPRVFTWIVNLATKCALDARPESDASYADLGVTGTLADITWSKYPNRCYLCVAKPCTCSSRRIDDLTDEQRRQRDLVNREVLHASRLDLEEKPTRINDWVEMFRTIYGPSHSRLSLAHKTLHFFEEVGELEVEFRKADKVRAGTAPAGTVVSLGQELADVFSWLVSMYLHISEALADAQQFANAFIAKSDGDSDRVALEIPSFSAWLWHEYGWKYGELRCHRCEQPVCTCSVHIPRR